MTDRAADTESTPVQVPEQAPASVLEPVETCQMFHEPPYDFAYCETHDTTFALGEQCKFHGRVMWEVFAEEADQQRMRAVRAEFEHDLLREAVAALAAEQVAVREDALARLAAGSFVDDEHQSRLSDAADHADRWATRLTALIATGPTGSVEEADRA